LGIRFSSKFGLRLSRETERLFKKMVEMGFIDKLNGGRIFKELSLTCIEEKVVEIFERFDREGILRAISPPLGLTMAKEKLLHATKEVLLWQAYTFPRMNVDKVLLYLSAIFKEVEPWVMDRIMKRISMPVHVQKRIKELLKNVVLIISGLQTILFAKKNINVFTYRLLKGRFNELILFAMAHADSEEMRELLVKYFVKLSSIKPLIGGKDLLSLKFRPSKLIGDILDAVLEEKLEGKLTCKEEEIFWVMENFKHKFQI